MPPKVKFTKDEIVSCAVKIVREKGVNALTAREMAAELGVSTRPIFTYFATMEELKAEVYDYAKDLYREYTLRGLKAPVPNLGVGQQHILFARQEPELYKLLYLSKPDGEIGGAMDALKAAQELVRSSIMEIYKMDANTADKYFRDLWLVSHSITTLIVMEECPYSDDEISRIFTEFSVSLCKAFKEIPGLTDGDFDRDSVFREIIRRD